MRIAALLLCGATLAACGAETPGLDRTAIPPEQLQSGFAFLTPDSQALQADSFANPGLLWVDRGATLFGDMTGTEKACQTCHLEGLQGVAARYPAIDPERGALLNLEGRINQCRTQHQALPALAYESEDLLALTAFIAAQSAGQPITVATDGAAKPFIEQGRAYFETRRGQFNLSCQQCHTETWGQKLRGDTLSQGHGNGFPAYRLEWQSLGSLQRRLRDCDTGVRAEPLPFGDDTYLALELFLAARANGLDMESPAVRR